MAKDIKFNIKLNIDGKNVVVQASQNVKELQRSLKAARTGSERLSASLIRINQVAKVYENISGSLGALSGLMNGYISKANTATEAQTKLTTIMRQRMGATEADTAAINEAVAAQTKLGIIGGTVQRSGLQQLATFASHRETLQTLLPAMNNLLAQQKGLNATSEDAVGVANLMGKALMGNVGALTRVGITLTDHQKELIKTGDEYTRATTLAQAITDNVGNMNSELAKTDAGQAKKAQMAFAGMEVAIGRIIAPFQGLMTQFAQIGLAIGGVGQLGAAVVGLARALGLVNLASSMWAARGKLMSSGMAHASKLRKDIRLRIYPRGGGFMITVKPHGKQGYHTNRKGFQKPVLMWAEEGTRYRFPRKGSYVAKTQRGFLRVSHMGKMPAYHFLDAAERTAPGIIESDIGSALETSVMSRARRSGLL